MLFIIDSKHTAETCPGGKIHPDKEWSNNFQKIADQSKLKIVEGYLDAPGHRFFFVVEASDVSQLNELIIPTLVPISDTKVTPVMKWSEAVALVRKTGAQD